MGHRRPRGVMLVVVTAAMMVSGCGLSSSAAHPEADMVGRPAPRAMLAQASHALRHLHSFRVQFSGTPSGHPRFTIAVAIKVPGRLSITTNQGQSSESIRVIGDRVFIQGNRSFYASLPSTARLAAPLAGKWIEQPLTANAGARALAKWSHGRAFARCLTGGQTGSLTDAGIGQVDDIPATVIRVRASRPGTASGLLYLSTATPHLLLREVQTGPTRGGGPSSSVCQLSQTSNGLRSIATTQSASPFHLSAVREVATFDSYDSVMIDAPSANVQVVPAPPAGAADVVTPTPTVPPPAGFDSGAAQAPRTGIWNATGTTLSSVGYSDDGAGLVLKRLWRITRSCAQHCSYTLARTFVGDGVVSVIRAPLVPTSRGWRATWPPQRLICASGSTGRVYWDQQEVWLLRFTHGGGIAQANESMFSFTPRCGYGRATVAWRAGIDRADQTARRNQI